MRVVLLDQDDRALLVRWRLPGRDVWGTPGGGVDPGETHEDAVRRELLEETGLELPAGACGPCVGHRSHLLPPDNLYTGSWDGQEEWFYLLRTEAFEPRGRLTEAELRAENLHELRWCSLQEVRELPDPHAVPPVLTTPRGLGELRVTLVADGHPATPLELAV